MYLDEYEVSASGIKDVKVSEGDSIDSGDPDVSVYVIFPPQLSDSPDFQFSKTNMCVLKTKITIQEI